MTPREILQDAFVAGVAAAQPANCLAGHWPAPPEGQLTVLAVGKAAATMAAAACNHYGNSLAGLVLVPDGHADSVSLAAGLQVLESAHPVPDERSLHSARAALALAGGMNAQDLLLVLLSGGASSVMALPREGVTLAQKQHITRALQDRGANIGELNCVRSALSAIKGGRLAAACAAPVVTLALSDIPGGDPALIASGPTVPLASTPDDASSVLRRYRIEIDAEIARLLQQPMPRPKRINRGPYTIVASGRTMLDAAAAKLADAGFEVCNFGDALQGPARELGAGHADLVGLLPGTGKPRAWLSGGETTVALCYQPGRGGRNTEYLLQLAISLDGLPGAWALAADSDGIDGHGGHAGALLAPDTLQRARELELDPREFLANNDSAGFFDALGDLLVTGPTQTNVNDFRVVLYLP